MIKTDEKFKCVGCGACENICPKKCITLKADEEGFLYPETDAGRCADCGLCEKACPTVNAEEQNNSFENVNAYAAYSLDEQIRKKSSSGGIFSLFAEYVLEHGGTVYGAAFDSDMNVCHIGVDNKKELYRLRGSKYVQSRMGDTYKHVLSQLKSGRYVLFTGTPCQTEALKAYLGSEYDNLICMDFICHGVPSPKVWRSYMKYREKKAASKTKNVAFRYKENGWKMSSVKFEFESGREYIKRFTKDLYMRAFLSDLCLRPSCYECKFKKVNRVSDITLADFWGIESILPDVDDDRGTSLCIIRSETGMKIFEALSERMKCKKANLEDAIGYNLSMIESAPIPPKRRDFMRNITAKKFGTAARKYSKRNSRSLIKRIIMKIKMHKFL